MSRLLLIFWCCFSVHVYADEPASHAPASISAARLTEPEDELSVLDEPHDYLASKFVGMVSGIDRFFGDERNYQEGNQSVLQLDVRKTAGYGGDKQVILAGRAKVNLPNTEKRLHLLIESNPDKNTSNETPQVQTTPFKDVSAPSSYAAAVRYEKSQLETWHLSSDAGLKFQGLNTSPFVRARASYAQPLENWRMKLTETAFWFNSTGMGASSQLDFERSLNQPMLLRASSNATWLHDKQNLDMRQDFSIFHTLNERAALLYQASAIGMSQPQFHASDYVFLLLYRYRLHQKWMYFEVSPQLHYPQINHYHPSMMLNMRIEILFDTQK